MTKKAKNRTVLILHNIRSTYNVGAMFRTAEATGIEKIYLTGITPTPLDRFGKERKDIAKSALGAEKMVAWEYVKNIGTLTGKLTKEKFSLIGVEQDAQAIDYKKFKPKERMAFVMGNEVSGIEKSVLKKCDTILEISMKGKKESLNVSVAAGIVLFRVLNI